MGERGTNPMGYIRSSSRRNIRAGTDQFPHPRVWARKCLYWATDPRKIASAPAEFTDAKILALPRVLVHARCLISAIPQQYPGPSRTRILVFPAPAPSEARPNDTSS